MDLGRILTSISPEGKAIPPHPALQGSAPVEFYTPPDGSRTTGKITQRNAARHQQAFGGTEAIDWVYDAVNFYADNASSAPWYFTKDDERLYKAKTSVAPPKASIAPAGIYDLFERPNPFMDYMDFMTLLIQDLLLVGNSYWFKWRTNDAGQPLALYRMAPPYVTVKPGPWGVEAYEYKPTGAKKALIGTPDEVIHFKLPNPHSAYLGMGVIQGGGRPLDLELSLTEFQASYHEKRGGPSMIVQSERRVSKDVFRKLYQQIRARNFGARNAGDLMILESGLKATTLSPNARDAMFAELSKLSRDRILAMFRLPPKLLGIQDESQGTDKAADNQRIFDNKAMKPFLARIGSKVTHELAAAWGAEFKIDYQYIMPLEDQIKLAGDFASIPGVTVREVREFLGKPPTGDPDIDDLVLNLPGDNGVPGNTRNGFPDPGLPGEGGRPPNRQNTTAFGVIGGGNRPDLVPGSRARRPSEKKALPSINEIMDRLEGARLEGKAVRLESPARVGIGSKLPGEQRPADALVGFRNADVDAVAAELETDFRDALHVLERGLLDHVEGKAFNPKTLGSRIKDSAAWKSFRDLVAAAMEKAAQRAAALAATHQATLGRPVDDLDYAGIAREVVYRKGGVRDITETFKESVLRDLGNLKDPEKAEVDSLIQDKVKTWREGKASTVAITEVTEAYNEGTLAVAEAAGLTTVLVTDGTDDDEPCIEADGQTWTIDEARSRRTEHPRCRRAFILG